MGPSGDKTSYIKKKSTFKTFNSQIVLHMCAFKCTEPNIIVSFIAFINAVNNIIMYQSFVMVFQCLSSIYIAKLSAINDLALQIV